MTWTMGITQHHRYAAMINWTLAKPSLVSYVMEDGQTTIDLYRPRLPLRFFTGKNNC